MPEHQGAQCASDATMAQDGRFYLLGGKLSSTDLLVGVEPVAKDSGFSH
jgi:hypothetical protein